MRILIAEAEAIARDDWARFLALGDHKESVVVADGETALELLGSQMPFDAFITGLEFQKGPTGLEVLESVKSIPHRKSMIRVLVTGKVDFDIDLVGQCWNLGAFFKQRADGFEEILGEIKPFVGR